MSEPNDSEAGKYDGLRTRTANTADSVLRTYKAHFKAGDSYTKYNNTANVAVASLAAIVTGTLIWNVVPNIVPILISLITAALSSTKTAMIFGNKAQLNNRAGEAYLRLLDDFRDFIQIELLPAEGYSEELEEQYNELESRRQELNKQYPSLHRRWYDMLDEEDIYSEIETTEEAEARLMDELSGDD